MDGNQVNPWVFAIRRGALAIPTILGVLLIVFALFRLVPGDAADLALGAHADQPLLRDLRHALGIDRPLLPDLRLMLHGELRRACDCQILSYLTGLFTGEPRFRSGKGRRHIPASSSGWCG